MPLRGDRDERTQGSIQPGAALDPLAERFEAAECLDDRAQVAAALALGGRRLLRQHDLHRFEHELRHLDLTLLAGLVEGGQELVAETAWLGFGGRGAHAQRR